MNRRDASDPAPRRNRVDRAGEPWPPFQLPPDHWLLTALRTGAQSTGFDPLLAVASPSNIGNLLTTCGIPATAGFGVPYRNLHAADEAVEVNGVTHIHHAYQKASSFFGADLKASNEKFRDEI